MIAITEVARGGAAAQHRAQHVGLPHRAEVIGIELHQGRAMADGGVVDEHVEPTLTIVPAL